MSPIDHREPPRRGERERRLQLPGIIRRTEWIAALLPGAILGLVLLGAGSRVSMWVSARLAGQRGGFTVGGTGTVVFLGLVAGVAGALVLAVARIALPRRQRLAAGLFWCFLVAVSLRGLRPLTAERLLLFGPLLAAYGGLLLLWSRRIMKR
ncbi:MAG: hypothetical protein ACT4OZ_07395 [Gemmatimonadota bacterium]